MTGKASKPLNALIVDDVASNRWVLGRLLNQLGVEWTEVGGGLDALRLLRRIPFDAVFMDVEMPSMDGPATTRRLRHMESYSGRHLPVIAFTSLESKEVRQRCFDAGMDAFMTKPVNLQLLRAVIDQVTSGGGEGGLDDAGRPVRRWGMGYRPSSRSSRLQNRDRS